MSTRRARTLGEEIERKADTESEGYTFTGDAHDLIVYGAKLALAEVRRRLRKMQTDHAHARAITGTTGKLVDMWLNQAINATKWRSK